MKNMVSFKRVVDQSRRRTGSRGGLQAKPIQRADHVEILAAVGDSNRAVRARGVFTLRPVLCVESTTVKMSDGNRPVLRMVKVEERMDGAIR